MNTDDQDDLWRLLGHAKAPSVSPFFSRNVLRAIREEKQEKRSPLAWVNWRWLTLCASVCVLVLASAMALRHPAPPAQADPVTVLAQQVSSSPDYQVINHLDELLASEETSIWLEK
jgi:xanthosine utilization system XapX-like protein